MNFILLNQILELNNTTGAMIERKQKSIITKTTNEILIDHHPTAYLIYSKKNYKNLFLQNIKKIKVQQRF